jgi:hypothetical protein
MGAARLTRSGLRELRWLVGRAAAVEKLLKLLVHG